MVQITNVQIQDPNPYHPKNSNVILFGLKAVYHVTSDALASVGQIHQLFMTPTNHNFS